MISRQVTGVYPTSDGPSASKSAQRMRAAIDQVVAVAPDFLRGKVAVGHMANTMVRAVRGYLAQEPVAAGDGIPVDSESQVLQRALAELIACGSGYLAGRCDAACVGRTMTHMVHDFGPQ